MPQNFIAQQILIGYNLLPEANRLEFESSQPGQQFTKIVAEYTSFLEPLNSTSWLTNFFRKKQENKAQCIENELKKQQQALELGIGDKKEYQHVVMQIMHSLLEKEVEEFQWLKLDQQKCLCKMPFSKKLLHSLPPLDLQIDQVQEAIRKTNLVSWLIYGTSHLENQLSQLKEQRKEAIALWKKEFSEHPNLADLRERIEKKKETIYQEQLLQKKEALFERVQQLAAFFPLLKCRKTSSEKPFNTQICELYTTENGELVEHSATVDKEQISDLLYHCMQQMNHIEIPFINLDEFHKKVAQRMALVILEAFNNKTKLDLDNYFTEYEEELYQYITEQLKLIDGKPWDNALPTPLDLWQSLSFLWNNPAANTVNDFLRKAGDAHGFIQATSFSTQNENSYLVFLDLYNYARHFEQISEVRSVFTNLLFPLLPIYDEYKDVALREKNIYKKLFRTIMPLIIVVGVILLTAVILGPLALPELAFAAAFIPALIIGLIAATVYIKIKDSLYKKFNAWYYSSLYEKPEYQVNERVMSIFGPIEGQQVRNYYVNEIKKCDELEVVFSKKHALGVLSQEDIDLRKETIKKRHQINMEWYDIHSNNDLSYKSAPVLVMNRLQKSADQEYKGLQETLEKELQSIRQSVAEATRDLKETIGQPQTESSEASETIPEAPIIKKNYRYGLFPLPQTLKARERVEAITAFKSQLNFALP